MAGLLQALPGGACTCPHWRRSGGELRGCEPRLAWKARSVRIPARCGATDAQSVMIVAVGFYSRVVCREGDLHDTVEARLAFGYPLELELSSSS